MKQGVMTVLVGMLVAGCGVSQTPGTAVSSSTSSSSAAPAAARPSGALPHDTDAACKIYSAQNATAAAMAFDGTVTAIGASQHDPEQHGTQLVATTFIVHRWYKGGSGDRVTVHLPSGEAIDPGPPAFDVGTRLLVSGTPDEGRSGGRVVAWGCGFTRYYDRMTADDWRAAFE